MHTRHPLQYAEPPSGAGCVNSDNDVTEVRPASSPVDLALREQREAISDLLGIVDGLASRLSVVLGPELPSTEGSQTLGKEPISPLVGIIGTHTGQVRHASRALATLLDRLTI